MRGHDIFIGRELSGGRRDVLIEDCVTVFDFSPRQIIVFTRLLENNGGEAAAAQPVFRRFRFENPE